jgi:peroxiredoxin
MKRILTLVMTLILCSFGSLSHAAKVGDPAPSFTSADSQGKPVKLSDYKGKFVVLEWHNQNCPFVKAQYNKGKMQNLQAKWTAKGVVWLRVISSASGKEGFVTGPQAEESAKEQGAKATDTLLDQDGVVGQAYGAKTTPHMFVINPKGTLIYNGAIDNAPRVEEAVTKTESGEPFTNYVDRALQESMVEKRKVAVPSTPPYGCGVKYK